MSAKQDKENKKEDPRSVDVTQAKAVIKTVILSENTVNHLMQYLINTRPMAEVEGLVNQIRHELKTLK